MKNVDSRSSASVDLDARNIHIQKDVFKIRNLKKFLERKSLLAILLFPCYIFENYLQNGALDRLSSKDFVVLARIVEKFASDCETVSGRQSHNLRGTLLSQAKRFIERFHDERRHKLWYV